MKQFDAFFEFSGDAQNELYDYIKALHPYDKVWDAPTLTDEDCPTFRKEVEQLRDQVENKQRLAVVKTFYDFHNKYTIKEQRTIPWLLGGVLGDALIQNEAGDKIICVYDRDRTKSMHKGARYHQTREGGSIHTDNVNVPELWDYLVLTCLSPAMAGGENILVDGRDIHSKLKNQFPDALKILEENFIWECRGVKDATYEAPIITYSAKGEPIFRHLRPYMEAAHEKTNRPMTAEQVYAVDTLDALLEHSSNQYRHTFSSGEILVTLDYQILHGRTPFSDAFNAVTIDEFEKDRHKVLKRTMDRLWVRK